MFQLKGKVLLLVARGCGKDEQTFRHPCPEAGLNACGTRAVHKSVPGLLILPDKRTFAFIIIYDAVSTVKQLHKGTYGDKPSHSVSNLSRYACQPGLGNPSLHSQESIYKEGCIYAKLINRKYTVSSPNWILRNTHLKVLSES